MSSNLTISFELIYLMGWLLQHEKGTLKELVKKAIDGGLSQELEAIDPEDHAKINEHLYTTILDFLLHLEEVLLEQLESVDVNTQAESDLKPALKKIDQDSFDMHTIWHSIRDVRSELSKHASTENPSVLSSIPTALPSKEEDAKKVLFKMLLKNWEPENPEQVN